MKFKAGIGTYSRLILIIFCLFFFQGRFGGLPAVCGKEAANQTNLTEDENAWLKAHPIIRLAPDPVFKPIEFFDQEGVYKGIAADYTQLLERKLGIKFEIIRCANWDDVTYRIKNRTVDVLNAVVKTPQRETYLTFPQPYLKIPSVIIVRKNVNIDLSLDMLKGMNIVMVSGYGYVDLIRNQYPGLNIELVPELKTALRKVSFGMADAFIGDLATTSFYIESEGITNLRLAGETEPPNISGFAVRSDWPELSRILEKGIARFTEEEKKTIFNKWIHLTVVPGMTMQEFKKYALLSVGIIFVLILCFLFLNRQLKRVVALKIEDLRREIEERKRAQEALRESETYLRTLIHTIPDLVWLKDRDGVYLFCNSRFERFFGATEENIIGKTDYDFVDKKLADFFREHDKLAMTKGSPRINEEDVIYADDGHHEILETIKTPLYHRDGQLIGVLGIARDITERKQAEEQRKKLEDQLRQSHKMEAIGTIAGGIAHDFNNILGIIMGNAELAVDTIEESNPALSNFKEIKKACLRASDVVRQLLNFSRKTEQVKKIIDIHPIITESIKLLRSSIPTSIDIQLNLDNSVRTILADSTQIHQVLINLCTNAAHAMEKMGGILKIDLSEVELDRVAIKQFQEIAAGHYVQLTISDTGHGIDSAEKTKIFDPYFTTKAVGKGTGMGLAVVLGIIKNHNGVISVYSEPGRGSTFKVLFPVAQGTIITDELILGDLPKGNERILLVDDEVGLVDIGSNILNRLGYKVETKIDPREAIALIQSDPSRFDLIITDMTMPHISGDQLIRQVLKINPEIPIILCTGFSNKIDSESAIMMGAKSYIEKPLNKNQLAYSVRKALDNT